MYYGVLPVYDCSFGGPHNNLDLTLHVRNIIQVTQRAVITPSMER